MSKVGKRIRSVLENLDQEHLYSVEEAVKLVKDAATAKFDETIEVAINLAVDPRHADQMVRGVVELPQGVGKTVRVAVFAKDDKAEEALTAGADLVGADDLAAKIEGGEMNFDRCISTPDMMPLVGKLGKVLGPRGLMPNPKLGSVTMDIKAAVEAAKGGQVEFRAENAGILQAGFGTASFSDGALLATFRVFIDAVVSAKPSGSKGKFVNKVSLSSSQGPGVHIELESLGV